MTQTPPSSYLASRLAQASGQPLPNGEALAAFTRRDDALAAFDVLSAAGFPVTALYLVNEGVKQVEYPLQRSYGRMLLSSLIWGIIAGLGCAALTIGDGSDFLGRAASTVPLSVAIFMVWTLVSIRRGGNSRYPMRGEAIPERTTMYALSEYAGQARMILRDTPGFAQAMRSVHGAAYGGGNATQQQGTTGTAAPRTGSTPSAPAGTTAGTAAGTESEPAKNTTGAPSGYGQGTSQDAGQAAATDTTNSTTPAAENGTEPQGGERAPAQPAAQRFGLRIDDPEEYAKTIRQAPARETPKPKGVKED
jgi:hypothetical protein